MRTLESLPRLIRARAVRPSCGVVPVPALPAVARLVTPQAAAVVVISDLVTPWTPIQAVRPDTTLIPLASRTTATGARPPSESVPRIPLGPPVAGATLVAGAPIA